jgi:hypothetical protein
MAGCLTGERLHKANSALVIYLGSYAPLCATWDVGLSFGDGVHAAGNFLFLIGKVM